MDKTDKTEEIFFDKLEKLIPINDNEGVLYLRNNLDDVSWFMRGSNSNLIAMLIGVAYANDDFKRMMMRVSEFLEENPTQLEYEKVYKSLRYSGTSFAK